MHSASESELWVVCPVCNRPNARGTLYCKYCWAILDDVTQLVSYEEAQDISDRMLSVSKRKKKTRIITFSVVTAVVLFLAVYFGLFFLTDVIGKPSQALNSDSLPGEWAMFRHDLSRSGTAGESGTMPQGTVEWTFATDSAIHSSPSVAYGNVYFGSRDGKLYALDADTGSKLWEFQTGSWIESSPAIVDGVVYFGSNDGKLYALDAYDGQELWHFESEYPFMSSPALADGVVYCGSDDYHLYALEASTGRKIWDFKTTGLVKSSPVIINGIVYVGGGTDYFYAINAFNGRLRLHFKSFYSVLSSAVVSGETVYFCNSNGTVFAIDGTARSWPREHQVRPLWLQLWVFGLPGIPEPPVQSGYLWGIGVGASNLSSPVLSGTTLYVAVDDKLVAIDIESQQVLWEFQSGDEIRSSPALCGDVIYIGSEDGRLYALDAGTGQKLWDLETGDKITASPAVVDGTIYITSHDGNLYAIR